MNSTITRHDEQPASVADTLSRSIQPSGFLLALSDDWRVECASANVGAFLGIGAAALIGRAASTFLTDDTIHALRNRLALLRGPDGIERLFACPLASGGHSFDIAIHIASDQVIVEAEPSTAKHFGDVTGTLRAMAAPGDEGEDLPRYCTAGARQMRALTGFDRVMVTCFKGDGEGVVVAESARGAIGSMVGTRIPPTSIAAYERLALRRSPIHCVADVEADLITIARGASDDISAPDLSSAVLRAPSIGQVDHLRAMGARASVSMALEVAGVLWGVISCQHQTPRRLNFERRAMAELFAQMFAMRIEILQLRARLASSRPN